MYSLLYLRKVINEAMMFTITMIRQSNLSRLRMQGSTNMLTISHMAEKSFISVFVLVVSEWRR